jgi:hypothetical protein
MRSLVTNTEQRHLEVKITPRYENENLIEQNVGEIREENSNDDSKETLDGGNHAFRTDKERNPGSTPERPSPNNQRNSQRQHPNSAKNSQARGSRQKRNPNGKNKNSFPNEGNSGAKMNGERGERNDGKDNNKLDNTIKSYTFRFKSPYYKEILHVQAFTIESWIGMFGGYVGLFLGISIWQVPSAFKFLFERMKYFVPK